MPKWQLGVKHPWPLALQMVHDPGLTVGPQQVGVSASKALTGVEEVEPL
jgi:hypothetical protein